MESHQTKPLSNGPCISLSHKRELNKVNETKFKNSADDNESSKMNGLLENHLQSSKNFPAVNGKSVENGLETNGFITNGHKPSEHLANRKCENPSSNHSIKCIESNANFKEDNAVVEATELTADVLQDLFNDKICVLCIRNYVPQVVCQQLDSFLREKESEPYTHEIRKDGKLDLLYFGVNRYGFPLNSIYNDNSGENLKKYLTQALPTMRSIRKAAAPYLSPIDKFRVEFDEAWPKKVNVATIHGQKSFCGIGRIMPTSLSELSETQPHFDAVPRTCFPEIYKQFTANFYMNVPEDGGELEIWNVPPMEISTIEKFTIPDNWRQQLPASIKVRPNQGDLLLFNTRRPHAITKFSGPNPRTSIQTFIGYTKESEIFLWV